MCSFIFTDQAPVDLDKVNYYTRFRGPDYTSVINKNGFLFVHNLLSITGDVTRQPFIDENIVCLYNGEIYNYKDFGDYHSDGECLIPLYKEHGPEFVKELDGEFALVLVDFSENIFLIATDPFSTKPLWYHISDEDIAVGSYESNVKELGLSATKLNANTVNVYELDTRQKNHSFQTFEWDLKQHKDSYDDWFVAFEEAVRKRTEGVREKIFIGLSSGYDSGAISCVLNKQHAPYKAYTVLKNQGNDGFHKPNVGRGENVPILNKRHELLEDSEFIEDVRGEQGYEFQQHLDDNVEEFMYRIYSSSSNYDEFNTRMRDDGGTEGLALVCEQAAEAGKKIYISGSGADETISDYGWRGQRYYHHSNFGGLFPEELELIFPWASFYGSSMVSYLVKEEYVAGSYGIETRYPFLDKKVVQEFLWLKAELKNRNYKSVIHEYLTKEDYPFEPNCKRGF
jgi:asparagine synthetase B (glutamine-hydrolysing)